MADKKPIPKSQEELRREQSKAYKNPDSGAVISPKAGPTDLQNRAKQVSRKNDEVKNLVIGIKDIDEAIYYYFNEVLQPTVIQNAKAVKVPLVYG